MMGSKRSPRRVEPAQRFIETAAGLSYERKGGVALVRLFSFFSDVKKEETKDLVSFEPLAYDR